jgi:diguanylate cyclase (GGDEF)-like protein
MRMTQSEPAAAGNTDGRMYHLYYYSVLVLGFAVLAYSMVSVISGDLRYDWLLFAALTALAGHFTIKLPNGRAKISVADTFIFTNIVLFGAEIGAITAVMEGLLGSIRANSLSRRSCHYTLFNVAVMAYSSYFSASFLFSVTDLHPLYASPSPALADIMLPILAMAFLHYLGNTVSVAIMVALETRRNLFSVWHEKFLWASLSYLSGASGAAFIVVNLTSLTTSTLGFVLPIVLVTYFAYKSYLDRAEENDHRKELDRLYLRTVEALSTAIDARESGTLGHGHRVQFYARRLSMAAGVSDEAELRGIDAAALLLDIGNLAVPEYILNNPEKLNKAEFEKVMIHPVVGANILATIGFPYPLEHFVRHHHERWDGLGYPDGLKGEQIPLGARILSLVDCFVALTCERPYQKARDREKALLMIRSKSGSYYDPTLVGLFDCIARDSANELNAIEEAERKKVQSEMPVPVSRETTAIQSRETEDLGAFHDIYSTQREVSALYELTHALGATLSLRESLSLIVAKLARFLTFDTCVIYLRGEQGSSLEARYVSGDGSDALQDFTIDTDRSLSGRVLNEVEAAFNESALEDLAPVRSELKTELEYATVCPLVAEEKCIGTISLYATKEHKFHADDLRRLANVSERTAGSILSALRFEEAREQAITDPLTKLPNMRYLRHFFETEIFKAKRHGHTISILVMDLDRFKSVNDLFGHESGDRVLVEVAALFKGFFRGEDLVIRQGGDEFIAVLVQTSRDNATLLIRRIQKLIDGFSLEVSPGNFAHIGVSIGCACYPEDGDSLDDLLRIADRLMYRNKGERNNRVVQGDVREVHR